MSLKRSAVVLMTLIGLLGLSGVATAQHNDSHAEDTWFSFGYEPVDHFLAINISPNDVDECALPGDPLAATYGVAEEDVYEVEVEGFEGICEISGVVVAGPNGQGVVSTPASMCAQIVAPYAPPGRIAIASQSGNFVSSFLNLAHHTGVGVSRAIAAGNAASLAIVRREIQFSIRFDENVIVSEEC